MVAKDSFNIGDLVWAKMKSYPDWPAKIVRPPSIRKAQHYVFFFGTNNHSWIKEENIKHHSEDLIPKEIKRRLAGYEEAIAEIKIEYEKFLKKPKAHVRLISDEDRDIVRMKKLEASTPKPAEKKSPKISKKRPSTTENENENEDLNTSTKPKTKKIYNSLVQSILPSMGQLTHVRVPKKIKRESDVSKAITLSKAVKAEPKKRSPTRRLGFLGLGLMGRGMVENLLRANHSVTIWNKSENKYDPLLKRGAQRASTVAEVIQKCDIIFCCVSDPYAVRTIVLGENGVLKGMENVKGEFKKGYVEMTTIDSETSVEIGEAISTAGMNYLEAPIIGSKTRAEEGTILILAAGNRELFTMCEPYFHAISNHAYYISCEVGKSANINIITSIFSGIAYSALAEVLSLSQRVDISQADLLEILELRGLLSPILMEKGAAIVDNKFNPETYLKHQQKDLNLGLRLSDRLGEPMPVAAAANEVYVRAKGLGFSEYDTAAVSLGYNY